MKHLTVKQCLMTMDKKHIAESYCWKYDLKVYDVPKENKDLTIAECKMAREKKVIDYIDHLLGQEPEENRMHMLFFAHECMQDEFCDSDIYVVLSSLEDIFTYGSKADSYGYILEKQSSVLGYYISEDPFTKANIEDVILDILYEMSFFGWKEEQKENVINELEQAEKEIRQGKAKCISAEEVFADLKEQLGFEFEKEDDPEGDALMRDVRTARWKYNQYHREKQLRWIENFYKSKD